MTDHDPIDDDLARAKTILARGRSGICAVCGAAYTVPIIRCVQTVLRDGQPASCDGGIIEGRGLIDAPDIAAAYTLLASFVAEVDRLRTQLRDLADDLLAQSEERTADLIRLQTKVELLRRR